MNNSKNDAYNKLLNIFSKADIAEINLENIEGQSLVDLYEKSIASQIRKKFGQFYTPRFVIKFMLDLLDSGSDSSPIVSDNDYLVLDPACGGGAFLMEIYDRLKSKLVAKGKDPDFIHERILRSIRGFEIDHDAVQLAEINLLLKGKNPTTSIKSIFKINFLDEEVKEKYDLIVGNPPYYLISQQISKNKKAKQFHTTFITKETINKYKKRYQSWPHNNKNPNISYLFVERSIELLKKDGCLAFILPDIILAGESTNNLRKFILNKCKIKKIVLVKGKLFKEGGISNIILVLQRCTDEIKRRNNKVEILQTSVKEMSIPLVKSVNDDVKRIHKVTQRIFYSNPFNVFSVKMTDQTSNIFQDIYDKLKSNELTRLGEITVIKRGIENLKKKQSLESPREKENKLISSSNILKYRIVWEEGSFNRRYVDYDPVKYKNIKFKNETWFIQPKIVLKRIDRKLVCAYDEQKFFALDSVQLIWLKKEYQREYSLRVLVALLNSDFLNFYYKILFSYKQLFAKVQKIYLENLPIPKKIDISIQKQIANLVKSLEEKYEEEVERELNTIVNSLYFTGKSEVYDYSLDAK